MRKELNFGNEVTEIPYTRFLLPRSMSKKYPKENCSGKNQLWQPSCRNSRGVRREKKRIVATKLPKFKGRERKKKDKKRIVATKLSKMRGKKNQKTKKKQKEWYFTLQHSHFGGPLHRISKKAGKFNKI